MDAVLYGRLQKTKRQIESDSFFLNPVPNNLNILNNQTGVGNSTNPINLVSEKPPVSLKQIISVEFQVATDSNFTNIIESGTLSINNSEGIFSCNKSNFSHNSDYYWRYKYNSSLSISNRLKWSTPTKFITGTW
jgi:hypothetical protein